MRENFGSRRPIAVIDTETNWNDQVMSLGAVLADGETLRPLDSRYYVLYPEILVGGMYSGTVYLGRDNPCECTRREAVADLKEWLTEWGVTRLFAYNAKFDRRHLPELNCFRWYDIMRMAAYRQYNRKIPDCADCCTTGRLRRNYGVEPMLQLLTGQRSYSETHNAVQDARDELSIMDALSLPLEQYGAAEI